MRPPSRSRPRTTMLPFDTTIPEAFMRAGPCFKLLLVAALAGASRPSAAAAQTSPAETAAGPAPVGLDTAGMDRSVKPGDSFFRYANGTWFQKTEIPADRSSYSAGTMLAEVTDRRVADLIQHPAQAAAPAGSDERKIGDYYTSF